MGGKRWSKMVAGRSSLRVRVKLLFLVFACTLAACTSLTEKLLKDPEVKVTDVQVTDISSKDLSLDLKLNINNPNPLKLKVGKITYGLNLEGDTVTEGEYTQGIVVPSNGMVDVVVPLKFKYNALQSLVSNLLNKKTTKDYVFKGSVDLGLISIPFEEKGQLKLGE